MSQKQLRPRYRRRLPLSLRISLLLMLAAIVPLLITVAGSELRSRPALVNQANDAMKTDAQSRVQLIDTYLNERLLDARTLTQIPSLVAFMATPPQLTTQDLIVHAGYALAAGILRDKHYTIWTLFDPQGQVRLYYPTTSPPAPRGQYLVPPADVQEVRSGKTFITPVYYNPKTQKAFVDIFSPIFTTTPTPTYLGFVRATLNIDFIWNVVNTDQGANGSGSYAFILDQNGVRIADTDPSRRFTAVAPLASQVQQTISSEARYGTTGQVPVLADSTLSGIGQGNHLPTTFQMTPGGQTGIYQVAQRTSTMVPWTYFVLSPVSTVTAVVNQQLSDTIIIAFIVLLLAATIGLIVGRYITRPILRSVEQLRSNSEALNKLATKQESAASEQTWVVDSSQVGLQSVQYYTNATSIAARRLSEIGQGLIRDWNYHNVESMRQVVGQMIVAAQYIEKAAHYQTASNQKLATAIKVTNQVNEQLAEGAISASDASSQLEQVVSELRQVVGR
jgi:Cache domain